MELQQYEHNQDKLYYGFQEQYQQPLYTHTPSQQASIVHENSKIKPIRKRNTKNCWKPTITQKINKIEPQLYDYCKQQQIQPTFKAVRKRRKLITTSLLTNIQAYFRKLQDQEIYGRGKHKKITIQIISGELDICVTEVRNLYEEYSIDPFFAYRKNILLYQNNNHPASQKLMESRIEAIEHLLKNDCAMTQQQIANQLNKNPLLKGKNKDGEIVDVSKKVISTLLKQAKYSRKKLSIVPKDRNTKDSIFRRKIYCEEYRKIQNNQYNLIYYLDESGFNMFTMRNQGWAKVGEKACKVIPTNKGKNVILLAIIGKQGLMDYELGDSYNAAKFCQTFDRMLDRTFTDTIIGHRYIIMDNCPIHHKQDMLNIEQKYYNNGKNIHIIYLPPYTPMLNPIENWFNEVKVQVKNYKYKTREQLKRTIRQVMSLQRNKSLLPYYNNIQQYLKLGCANLPYL